MEDAARRNDLYAATVAVYRAMNDEELARVYVGPNTPPLWARIIKAERRRRVEAK